LSVLVRTVRRMNLNLGMVTIDCTEPRELAEFWTKALGLEVVQDFEGYYMVLRSPGDERATALGLQKVPEPRAGKNRVHLDLATEDRPGEVARLVALGATQLDEQSVPGLDWTVLQDPAGNEFCVGSPH
jgi:catechol 2,3-dioxygenase-like lactoylglutathione lyase family enzyme